ncbi:hypothetical protein Tco_1029645 [Tanacetum coccineum]|uniref:Uncharacterized protein n=1 Tax=Tanacetum coccineum TaxID=301880 RepID=A0ABQ5G414_9ASTR
MSLEALQEKREGEGDDADLERAIKLSLDPTFLPQGRAPIGGVTIRDPVSETTSKLHEVKKRTTDQFILVRRDQTSHDSTTGCPLLSLKDDTTRWLCDKDQGEVDSSTVTSGVSIPVSDPVKAHKALAGPDPKPMKEDQTGSDSRKLHVSLAGPNPEHMDDEIPSATEPTKGHENTEANFTLLVILYTDVTSSKAVITSHSSTNQHGSTTITTVSPENHIHSSPLNQLRGQDWSKRLSEVKKLKNHILLMFWKRHTAIIIKRRNTLCCLGPESSRIKKLEKSPKEIIKIKKEQVKEKQIQLTSIRSTDKVDLKEFDLKSLSYKHDE